MCACDSLFVYVSCFEGKDDSSGSFDSLGVAWTILKVRVLGMNSWFDVLRDPQVWVIQSKMEKYGRLMVDNCQTRIEYTN